MCAKYFSNYWGIKINIIIKNKNSRKKEIFRVGYNI